ASGNLATPTLRFLIDKPRPQFVVTGVQDGGIYNVNVTPTIQVTDAHLRTQTATLNGQPFVSATAVTAEGDYTLVVAATDTAGNQATTTVRFTIDKTPPTVTITQPAAGT